RLWDCESRVSTVRLDEHSIRRCIHEQEKLQLDQDQSELNLDSSQRPLQGAFLIPPVLPVVLIFSELCNSGDTILNFSELGMVSLRQVSFGKEEETRTLKPFVETLRVRIPPGKAGPAARSESCVVVGRPILRSVDSEVKGRVIEPRKYKTPGAFVVDTGGGRVRQLTLGPLSLPDPTGVEEHGQRPPGFPRNLRDPDVSIV